MRVLRWVLVGVVLLPIVMIAAVFAALNVDPGRRLAERGLAQATGNQVVIEGLEGRFPDRLRLGHLELRDAGGVWLTADSALLEWSPLALLHGQVRVGLLEAGALTLRRLPASQAAAGPAQPSKPFSLPVRVTVDRLAIRKATIGGAVLGEDVTVAVDGQADLTSLETGEGRATLLPLAVDHVPGGGVQPRYTLTAKVTDQTIDAHLTADDPANGLISRLAKLPDIGAIGFDGLVMGPKSALVTRATLTAGPLSATVAGTVDLGGNSAKLDVTAKAPAMTPAPGVSWQSIALDAHVAGPFTAPDATGHLQVMDAQSAGSSLKVLTAELSGNAGQAALRATLEGLRLPGPKPDLLAAAPIRLTAHAQLDAPGRPVEFTLAHPLLAAEGRAVTAGAASAVVTLHLLDLGPVGAIAGLDIAGRSELTLKTVQSPAATTIDATGRLALTKGPAPAPALLGTDAKLALSARLVGSSITLSTLTLDGAAISFVAQGSSTAAGLDATAKVSLPNLALAVPTIDGTARLDAHIHGPANALAVDAAIAGDVGGPNIARAPIRVTAALTGLPGVPAGHITGQGTLEGAPINLVLDATRTGDGALHATISQADWRSLHAEGVFTLPQGAVLPIGHVAVKMSRLDDLRPLIGQAVSGSLSASATSDAGAVSLDALIENAGVTAARVGRAVLKARVVDPIGAPVVDATLDASGFDASGTTGAARVEVRGGLQAVAIKGMGKIDIAGIQVQLAAMAGLNAVAKKLRVQSLEATVQNASVKPETGRLLAPATVDFADGLAVDRMRIGLREAVLDLSGRVSPRLDVTAVLRSPAGVAAALDPGYALDGSVALDAHLTGSTSEPGGSVKLSAVGIRARTGPGRALPPANLTATAQLAGGAARLDARLVVGTANLAVTGQVPLGTGGLNLKAGGALDLALLNPILNASGRNVSGRVLLDAGVTGTVASPVLAGSAQVVGGDVQDFTQGVHLTAMQGTVRLDDKTLRIGSLTAQAGPGTVVAAGTVGVLEPGLPANLTVTMRNARPLASDTISANLDAELTIQGNLSGGLKAGGHVSIRRAELQIPKTLPASVVVLNVRRPGDKPAAPAAVAVAVGLDLTIDAPNSIFVRGRGVDAELAGNLRVEGTSLAPRVGGGLTMRRGSISVAGTTLDFSRGKVGFDGTGVSGKIDPTLDFAADSTAGGVTATLAIGGYVSKPKITLSSVPDLPQDEVLAYLIFKRSAKELGPFQIAEIAAALADLTGVGGGGGLNPLESIRKGLGLDRLSLGAGAAGNTAPTVEAGRYVADGVYVGAKQGTTGGQTQATVQIDITKGLKLETDVGTGQGGNQVGVTYQFEY